MDNNKILKDRWNEVDNKLSAFYSKNNRINKEMYKNLQSVFDSIKISYGELKQYASAKQVAKLRVAIDDIKVKYSLSGYVGYELSNLYKRRKLKNEEVILGLILVEYYRLYNEQKELEMKMFDEISNLVYKKAQEETISIVDDKKKNKKKRSFLTIPNVFLLQLIGMSSFNGFKWYDYKEGNISYNANKLYEKVVLGLQKRKKLDVYDDEFMNLLNKQERAYFNKKKEVEDKRGRYVSDYSGMLDNEISFIVNQTALQGMIAQGCKKVQFIAVMDEKTTDMCESLDGQIFNIDGWNTFSRYSKEDGKNVVYKVKGLEVGMNLPPINNGFHYCRSTIYPYR